MLRHSLHLSLLLWILSALACQESTYQKDLDTAADLGEDVAPRLDLGDGGAPSPRDAGQPDAADLPQDAPDTAEPEAARDLPPEPPPDLPAPEDQGSPEEPDADMSQELTQEPCGDLLLQATLGPEHLNEWGNYVLPLTTPLQQNLQGYCPDPGSLNLDNAPELVVRFVAPRNGHYTFETQGIIPRLSSLRSCQWDPEQLECGTLIHYHSDDFDQPRRLRREMRQGEEIVLVLESFQGGQAGLIVHTPLQEGQYCVNENSRYQRFCGEGLWCDTFALVAEERICRAIVSPTLLRASLYRSEDALLLRADLDPHGVSPEHAWLQLLDAQGQVLGEHQENLDLGYRAFALDQTGVPDPGLARWEAWEDPHHLYHSALYDKILSLRDDIDLDQVVSARVRVVNVIQGVSQALEIPVQARPQVRDACDPYAIANTCPPGQACSLQGQEHRCQALEVGLWRNGDQVHNHAQVDHTQPGADPRRLFILDLEGNVLSSSLAHEDSSPQAGLVFKNTFGTRDGMFEPRYQVALGHQQGVWGTPVEVSLADMLPEVAQDQPCDGARVTDLCQEGTACFPLSQQPDQHRCQLPVAPQVDEARMYRNADRHTGFLLRGTDPNRDLQHYTLVRLDEEGEPISDEPNLRPLPLIENGRLDYEGDRFTLRCSWPWSLPGPAYRVAVVDSEGLRSEPVVIQEALEPEPLEAGEICDINHVLDACPDGHVCDLLPGDAAGFRCHSLEQTACLEGWPVRDLSLPGQDHHLELTGDLQEGQELAPGCQGESWRDTVYRVVAPQEGLYTFAVDTQLYNNPTMALRSHCALPRAGEPVCADIYNIGRDTGHSELQGWLQEGETAYLFLYSRSSQQIMPYTLTVTW